MKNPLTCSRKHKSCMRNDFSMICNAADTKLITRRSAGQYGAFHLLFQSALEGEKREGCRGGWGGGLDYKAVAGECIFHACWAAWAGRVWRGWAVHGGRRWVSWRAVVWRARFVCRPGL